MPRTLPLPQTRRRRPPQPGAGLRLSEEAYLARERDPARALERKSELFADGVVREMAGVSRAHGLLANRLSRLAEDAAGDDSERFEFYVADVKFRPPQCRYFYPDVMVLPSPPLMRDAERDVMLNPVFVAEVLSDSTEQIDRGEKLDCYLGTPSALEYWLVAQDAVRVERWHRPDAATPWVEEVHDDRAASVPLPPLGGVVSLDRLYRQALPAG